MLRSSALELAHDFWLAVEETIKAGGVSKRAAE